MRSFFFVALFLACSCVYADETYINGRKALITEIQEFGGLSSDPSVSPAHKARIFYQTSSDTLKLSLNGGAYSSLLTTETDPIVGAVNGIVKADGAGNISAIPDNSSNWNTAYGWGDHAAAGYLITESDPIGKQVAISFVVDGQGQAIAANPEWHQKVVPCNMTISSWHLDGDVSGGNVELDVQVSTASPYTSYTSICGTEKPNITGAYTNTSSTLSGWTITLTEGSRLRIYPTAGATHKKATLTLLGDKT